MKEFQLEDCEKELREVLASLETSINFLKDGKEIPAFNKLQGVKQKLAIIYNIIKANNIKANKDKKIE